MISILLGLLLLFIVFATHELGHAFAMKRNGVPMDEICIFGFGYMLFTFKAKRFFGDTPITIRLIPLGAFVNPKEFSFNKVKAKNDNGIIEIQSAGIANNFILAALCWFIKILSDGAHFSLGYSIVLVLIFALGLFPKYIGRIYPLIGLFFMFLLIKIAYGNFAQFSKDSGSAISILKDTSNNSKTIFDYIKYIGDISISVALFNCIPMGPLDGGKIFLSMISKVFHSNRRMCAVVFNWVTILPLFIFLLYSVVMDIIHIFMPKWPM